MNKLFLYATTLLAAAILLADAASAQAIINRSEFVCFDKREDAKRDVRTNNDKYIVLSPTLQFEGEGSVRAVYEQLIEVPASWNDYNAYLHTENVGADYTVFVNGKQISSPIDRFTPTDLFISPYLDQGENTVAIVVVDEPYMASLAETLQQPARKQFENCYIFAQRRLAVYDFNVRMLPDSLDRFAQLRLDVVVDNSFSTPCLFLIKQARWTESSPYLPRIASMALSWRALRAIRCALRHTYITRIQIVGRRQIPSYTTLCSISNEAASHGSISR